MDLNQALALLTAAGAAPQAPLPPPVAAQQMDLQALATLAALQQQGQEFGAPGLPLLQAHPAPSGNGKANNRGGGGGGRTRSGDSRSSSAYASRHQVGSMRVSTPGPPATPLARCARVDLPCCPPVISSLLASPWCCAGLLSSGCCVALCRLCSATVAAPVGAHHMPRGSAATGVGATAQPVHTPHGISTTTRPHSPTLTHTLSPTTKPHPRQQSSAAVRASTSASSCCARWCPTQSAPTPPPS